MELLNFTIKVAQKAGKLAEKLGKKTLEINYKGKNDIVTAADLACQKLIIKEIKSKYKDHAIIAEEDGHAIITEDIFNSEYIWIIDPIDGTTNYSRGIPFYAVSIALFKTTNFNSSKSFDYLEGEVILGVVYAPALNQLFHAASNKGAFLNNKKIEVSKTKTLSKSLLATGFPNNKDENLPYFNTMIYESQAMRRFGSAAIDLAYTAAGLFDGYWEFGLKAWDIAAGALIVKEAGGKVSDINGNLLDLFGGDILATNGQIHKGMIKTFSQIPSPLDLKK